MKKRVVAAFMSLVMCVAFVPAVAFAGNGDSATGDSTQGNAEMNQGTNQDGQQYGGGQQGGSQYGSGQYGDGSQYSGGSQYGDGQYGGGSYSGGSQQGGSQNSQYGGGQQGSDMNTGSPQSGGANGSSQQGGGNNYSSSSLTGNIQVRMGGKAGSIDNYSVTVNGSAWSRGPYSVDPKAGDVVTFNIRFNGGCEYDSSNAYFYDDYDAKNKTQTSLDISVADADRSKKFTFTMPELGSHRGLLIEVNHKEQPIFEISNRIVRGAVVATQNGKQLAIDGAYEAGVPIFLEWIQMDPDYRLESLSNTYNGDNQPKFDSATGKWVIANPTGTSRIMISGSEVRYDGKVEAIISNSVGSNHLSLENTAGEKTAFFSPGETVHVRVTGADGYVVNPENSRVSFSKGSGGSSETTQVERTSDPGVFSFAVPSNADELGYDTVHVYVPLSWADESSYILRLTGIIPGNTSVKAYIDDSATPVLDAVIANQQSDMKPEGKISKSVFSDGGEHQLKVVVTPQDGSQYEIKGTLTYKGGPGGDPYSPRPSSKQFGFTGDSSGYVGEVAVTSQYVYDNSVEVGISHNRSDNKHAFAYVDYSYKFAPFKCYVVKSPVEGRVSDEPVSYALAGETLRFVCEVADDEFIPYFNCGINAEGPLSRDESAAPRAAKRVGANTFEYEFTGAAAEVTGSSIAIVSQVISAATKIDLTDSLSAAEDAKSALSSDAKGILNALVSGSAPTGMSASDASALSQAMQSGVSGVTIVFSAEDATLTDEQKNLVKSALGEEVVTGDAFDLSVNLRVAAGGSTGGEEGGSSTPLSVMQANLTELDQPVSLSAQPNDSVDAANRTLYRIHKDANGNDVVEQVEGATTLESGTIDFSAGRFSTYFVVDKTTLASADPGTTSASGDENVNPGSVNTNAPDAVVTNTLDAKGVKAAAKSSGSPSTGDSFLFVGFGALAGLCVIAGGLIAMLRRRSHE